MKIIIRIVGDIFRGNPVKIQETLKEAGIKTLLRDAQNLYLVAPGKEIHFYASEFQGAEAHVLVTGTYEPAERQECKNWLAGLSELLRKGGMIYHFEFFLENEAGEQLAEEEEISHPDF
ncbi:MAG: hypothetical protein H6581_24230 [Bacteroidia bacterium]|nr:hypothetical protein [Bacteroidia bacterium]